MTIWKPTKSFALGDPPRRVSTRGHLVLSLRSRKMAALFTIGSSRRAAGVVQFWGTAATFSACPSSPSPRLSGHEASAGGVHRGSSGKAATACEDAQLMRCPSRRSRPCPLGRRTGHSGGALASSGRLARTRGSCGLQRLHRRPHFAPSRCTGGFHSRSSGRPNPRARAMARGAGLARCVER